MINLATNYNILLIIVTILVHNNFLFYKLVFKLVPTATNNFCSLKLVVNGLFSCIDIDSIFSFRFWFFKNSALKVIRTDYVVLKNVKVKKCI